MGVESWNIWALIRELLSGWKRKEKSHNQELEHPLRYHSMCPLKGSSHWSFLEPRIFGGVCLGHMEFMTTTSKSYWHEGKGVCVGILLFPADLGPSHLLLPWHLLHGSLKKFGKHLPDVFWGQGIPPRWRERTLNELGIFWFYFSSQVSQQLGDLGLLTGVLFCGACSWLWLDVGSF